ncbi:MAG: saccharopine dehydrogenase family protein [Promethearchaeota archaeon]
MKKSWILYGANGYTGILLAKEAKENGLNPIIAGRSKEKIHPLAEKLDLEYLIFDLNDEDKLIDIFQNQDLILNAAGPFKYTSKSIVNACLKSKAHYLDITGEVPVFEENFKLNQQAIDSEIAIISGVGFDVVPTDCMASYIHTKIDNPIKLDIGVAGVDNLSRGTLKTMIEYFSSGSLIRRDGNLMLKKKDEYLDKIRFYDKDRKVLAVSWGDLATAFKTTSIPNITTYMPPSMSLLKLLKSSGTSLDGSSQGFDENKLLKYIEDNVYGPDENVRSEGTSHIWVSVSNQSGDKAEAWLETIEPYRFTVLSGIKAVEKVINSNLKGSLTPSLAFGADFVLEFPDTTRHNSLD